MSVTFNRTPQYALLGDGRLIQTGWHTDNIDGSLYVGGKIFYIDNTSSGATYTFYSETGKVLTDVRVGDEPFAYTVDGTPNKDKYYVFNSNAVLSKTWTYQSEGSWVRSALGTTDGIGSGKTNTTIVVAADNGAYVSYANTIWNSLSALNIAVDKGCNDWYVPSKTELETLRTATDRDGNALTTLLSTNYIWSSSEYTDYPAPGAWLWYFYQREWSYNQKSNSNALVATRSF